MSHPTVHRRVAVALAVLLVAWALPVRADGQAAGGYRGFQLGASVEAVAAAAGLNPTAVQTLHTRPALIQELGWWPPHVRRGTAADSEPVEHMTFRFYNNQLYRIAVIFSPEQENQASVAERTRLLSAEYGTPMDPRADGAGDGEDGVLLAAWGTDDLSVRLSQTSQALRLVLTARGTGRLAADVAGESRRLLEQEDRVRRLPDSPAAAMPEARFQ